MTQHINGSSWSLLEALQFLLDIQYSSSQPDYSWLDITHPTKIPTRKSEFPKTCEVAFYTNIHNISSKILQKRETVLSNHMNGHFGVHPPETLRQCSIWGMKQWTPWKKSINWFFKQSRSGIHRSNFGRQGSSCRCPIWDSNDHRLSGFNTVGAARCRRDATSDVQIDASL